MKKLDAVLCFILFFIMVFCMTDASVNILDYIKHFQKHEKIKGCFYERNID